MAVTNITAEVCFSLHSVYIYRSEYFIFSISYACVAKYIIIFYMYKTSVLWDGHQIQRSTVTLSWSHFQQRERCCFGARRLSRSTPPDTATQPGHTRELHLLQSLAPQG